VSAGSSRVTPLFGDADPARGTPAQRRLAVLQELIGHGTRQRDLARTCELVTATLSRAEPDIAFVALHLLRPDGWADAVGLIGVKAGQWPLDAALEHPVVLDGLRDRFGDLPAGSGDRAARRAVLLPLRGASGPLGVLVLGSATAPDDEEPDGEQRRFLDAVAAQAGALLDPVARPAGRLAEERATARRLDLLQRATADLSAAATPDQVVDVTRRHLARLLASPAVAIWERDGDTLRAAAMDGWDPTVVRDWTALPLVGEMPVADAARDRRPVLLECPEDWERDYPHLQDVVAASGYRGLAVWPLVVAGEGLGSLAVGFPQARELGAEELATAAALAEQCGQAVARSRLLQAESDARRDAVRLGAALAALSAAVDMRAVAAVIVEQAVTAGAVAVVVAVRGEEKQDVHLDVVAAVGFPRNAPRRLAGTGPLAADRSAPDWSVASGAAWGAPEEPYPVHSVIPLHVAGGRVGSLGIVWKGDPPAAAERSLLVTVAGQGAQALDRARLQQAEHEVAVTLQRVLLPAASPGLERLAVATRYLPAGRGTEAGGDWYDVIPLDDGGAGTGSGDGAGSRVAFVVGDVVGHGPHAAGVMGQLRSALAAYLLDDHGPAEALERLDRFARRVDGARASTVSCGVLDRATGELCWARAGHVPALVVDGSGARFLLGGSGTVLGVRGRPPFTEERVVLEPGSSVVLYTDGLVERRGEDVDAGLDRLRRAVADLRDLGPEHLASGLLAHCLGGGPADDVALVVIRLLPAPLENTRPAEPGELARVRREIDAWAGAAALPDDQLGDLQLTLGEALANGVEHAYLGRTPGEVGYRVAMTADGAVAVEVRDGGHWRPRPVDPGHRGRGLLIIDRIGVDATVEGSDHGTVVRFTVAPPQ
jgi:serine phosphatase RsbU (regulator of sigma subunit)/anti-sigma regulatory factor (Ser/Thr protein kinase)